MLALIDFDVVIYAIGFTTQEDPVDIAYIRTDEFISNIILETNATDYQGYLSDSKENNYRFKVDSEYKANRTQPKPLHYDAIKEYLVSKHNGKIAYGMEADDMLAIHHVKEKPSIICTIDKDLNQVPGLHYTWTLWRKGEVIRPSRMYEVDEKEAIKFFYKQMLIGDRSDNIVGIEGIGEKKAESLINPLPNERAIYFAVVDKYKEQWGDLWEEKMDSNGKLLWIKRDEEDNWELSTKKAQFGEEE